MTQRSAGVSLQVNDAIKEVDGVIGSLLEGIKDKGLEDSVRMGCYAVPFYDCLQERLWHHACVHFAHLVVRLHVCLHAGWRHL